MKLMCIGDSLTNGGFAEYKDEMIQESSYRYELWKMFVDNNENIEFIGSLTEGFKGNPIYPDYKGLSFPNIHEGRWGWTTQAVIPEVEKTLESGIIPDMAVVFLGTNNYVSDTEVNYFIDHKGDKQETNKSKVLAISSLVKLLRKYNSSIKIVLGCCFCEWTQDLRDLYGFYADYTTTDESPILCMTEKPEEWVDNPEEEDTCTIDWVHTKQKGDFLTAREVYKKIKLLKEDK